MSWARGPGPPWALGPRRPSVVEYGVAFILPSGAALLAAALALPLAAATGEDTLRFSEMMRRLSRDPAFVERVIQQLGRSPASSAMLGPADQERLRQLIRRRDWSSLDRFPAMTVAGMGRALAAARPVAGRRGPAPPPEALPVEPVEAEEDLGIPSRETSPSGADLLRELGHGVESGSVLDPEAARLYPDSRRLASLLNRLSLNPSPGATGPRLRVSLGGRRVQTAQGLVSLLAEQGHEVSVSDERFFANFGNLRFLRRDVATPFWIDTRLKLPGRRESLVVPAVLSQHALRIRGSRVNADVFFYFGIDGAAAFRAFAAKDQSWILGRRVWTYRGRKALEAVRLAAAIRRTYEEMRRAHPRLPFGGYYAFGVCNDANAMLELALQGRTTLFPLTRDPGLFPRDGEVGRLARALPCDRVGLPDPERVLGSLPTDDLGRLPFPGLAADLAALRDRGPDELPARRRDGILAVCAAGLGALLLRLRSRRRAAT